jgi:hypothetical protein
MVMLRVSVMPRIPTIISPRGKLLLKPKAIRKTAYTKVPIRLSTPFLENRAVKNTAKAPRMPPTAFAVFKSPVPAAPKSEKLACEHREKLPVKAHYSNPHVQEEEARQ